MEVPTTADCSENLTNDYRRTWRGVQQVYRSVPYSTAVGSGLAAYRNVFAHQAWGARKLEEGGAGACLDTLLAGAAISPSTTLRLIARSGADADPLH